MRRAGSFVPALLALSIAAGVSAAEWTPAQWVATDTLELKTDVPGEGEYWFKVWLVVIDGQVYVRLGARAANRIEKSRSAPYVGVRIAGAEFDRVRAESVPDSAERVAQALGDKYWSDVFIRYFSHPLTMRLVPP
jgi:hypothetical protein